MRGLPGVSEVVRISAPYKLVKQGAHRGAFVIRGSAGRAIGPDTRPSSRAVSVEKGKEQNDGGPR